MIGSSIWQVVQFVEDDRRERLLWLDPDGRGGLFIDIDDEQAVPVCRGQAEIKELLAEALLDITDDPWLGCGEALSETQETRGDDAWQAIKPIAMAQLESFDPQNGQR